MLPKDLLTIIENYNEEGIFIITRDDSLKSKIYWFNGKRLEYFFVGPYDGNAIGSYDGVLYSTDLSCDYVVHKNKEWILFNEKLPNHINQMFDYFHFTSVNLDGIIHYYTFYIDGFGSFTKSVGGEFKTNYDLPQLPIPFSCGARNVLAYEKFIFIFHPLYYGKFDIESNIWINLPKPPITKDDRVMKMVFLFKDLFYMILGDKMITFNPKIEIWNMNFLKLDCKLDNCRNFGF